MERRSFLSRTVLAVAVLFSGGLSLVGCTASSVMQDLFNWIPVGLSAVNSVLTLLSGAGILLGPGVLVTIAMIQTGLTDLKLAIAQYQSTTPPPVGSLAKIDTFLSDLVSNLGNVLNQLPSGPANIVTLVAGLGELVLTTIQGFMVKIPAVAASLPKTQATLGHGMMISGQAAIPLTPRKDLTRRGFIHDFNKQAVAGGHPEAKLHESLIQHL
jgi:hypothetical protein